MCMLVGVQVSAAQWRAPDKDAGEDGPPLYAAPPLDISIFESIVSVEVRERSLCP
jgi:hypothetical protein